MYLKIHERQGQRILAACDKELIGKIFEEKGAILDLKNYSAFYKGTPCTKEELLREIPSADSINLVGEKAVSAGMKSGLFTREEVKYINGIPHIQLYRV